MQHLRTQTLSLRTGVANKSMKKITNGLGNVIQIAYNFHGRNTEQNTLNDVRNEYREVGMNMTTGGCCLGEVSSKPTGCVGEVQAGKYNGGDALNAVRDEYREVGMNTSTEGGCFGEVSSKPMDCFEEVQLGTNNGGDALNAVRIEQREVGMNLSTGGSYYGEVSSKPTDCFGEVQVGVQTMVETL